MRIRASTSLVIPFILIVAACGGGGTPAPSTGGSAGASAAASTGGASPAASTGSDASFDAGSGTADGSFTVKIDGSSFAGTYTGDPATGGCGVSNGTLSLVLGSDTDGPNGQGVYVSLTAALAAATTGTKEFSMSVAFGAEGAGTVGSYPAPTGANGNLKVTDNGSTMSAEASGDAFYVSQDGSSGTFKIADLKATCTTVARV